MSARLEDLHPTLRPLVEQVLRLVQGDLDLAEPGRWHVMVHETHRSADDQERYRTQGRSAAPPARAPHCMVTPAGAPAACAADLWIVERSTGRLAPDGASIWALIPAACYRAGAADLVSGASFKAIPGGDWPHVELAKWRVLLAAGQVRAP